LTRGSSDEAAHEEGQVVPACDSMLIQHQVNSIFETKEKQKRTQKALVKKVIMLLILPGFLPAGVTRL
jgi:tetrahydromethanopterin S-methyltransferase subunit C